MSTMAGSPSVAPKRVLIIDDDPSIRSVLSDMLTEDGFVVDQAEHGEEGLHRLLDGPAPDVILLDLMMPVMDGWQFRQEQRRDPRLSSIPVIALSADSSPKAAAVASELYIPKPYDYDVLLEAIRGVLQASEGKRAELQLWHSHRMASLGTLAAGLAQEIGDPLTVIAANLTLLQESMPWDMIEGPDARYARAMLIEALEGAERLRNVVADVSAFASPDQEEQTTLEIRPLVDSAVQLTSAQVRARARLVTSHAPAPDVLANRGQLAHVFVSLLLNAAEAIPEGEAQSHEIRVTTRTSETGRALVEIADDGCGIPATIRPKIFDPFFTTKPLSVGSGLGLSLCDAVVRSIGGDISVESEPGKGSVFRVSLPPAA